MPWKTDEPATIGLESTPEQFRVSPEVVAVTVASDIAAVDAAIVKQLEASAEAQDEEQDVDIRQLPNTDEAQL